MYGDGQNVRDWIYVEDHCSAIRCVLHNGRPGRNLQHRRPQRAPQHRRRSTPSAPCSTSFVPTRRSSRTPNLITYVTDRPGHDRRYAIDSSRIERELGLAPQVTFEAGIRNTVAWYLDHQDWVADITSGSYRDWIETQYAKRGGGA